MHTVVLTKGVPDFREGKVSFDEDGHLERGKTPTVMNPNDKFALEAALQTRVRQGGRVTVMSMGPPGYQEVLQEAMASSYADDLYLVSDREMAAADTWATAITLSAAIERLGMPDLIFAGFKTADGETGHTGPQTCWCLDLPILTHVISLDVDEEAGTVRAERLVEGDITERETVETSLPAFVVADPEFTPSYRSASHRLTLKELRSVATERAANFEDHLTVWDHSELNLDPDYIGLDGSPTIVSSVDPIPKAPAEREATMVSPTDQTAMTEVFETMQPFAVGASGESGTVAADGGVETSDDHEGDERLQTDGGVDIDVTDDRSAVPAVVHTEPTALAVVEEEVTDLAVPEREVTDLAVVDEVVDLPAVVFPSTTAGDGVVEGGVRR